VTFVERVHAVAEKGFTERQAGFLVTVMLHSGVCVRRQYCLYARIAHGQKDHDFFASLLAKKRATSYAAAKGRSGFTCYRAFGARLGGLRTTGRSGRGVDPRLAEELLS